MAVFIAAYDSARDIMAKHQTPYPIRETLALKVEREISNRRHDILPPQAKVAANYTSPTIAKRKARADGFDDVLLLTERGTVAEAPTSNIFVVRDGGLSTPPDNDVLLGITRASIIEIAGFLNLQCEERELQLTQLYAADEAFLTGTVRGVTPVVHAGRKARFVQAVFVDTAIQKRQFFGHRQHHRKRVLCHGDVHSPAQRMDLHPARGTCLKIDVAGICTEILNNLKIWRGRELLFSDGQAFADDPVRIAQRTEKRLPVANYFDVGREQPRHR